MSMLAEKRRKQKWSLNPRGKEWSQDSNKFGQKLLEKMGWSHGKGLGAKEDGITEHIKVSYKNDSQGMGYKESNDQWTEHESNFSALLESLTGTESKIDELKVNSLEKKSKTSRARVHYHKFTRGKDLSRYSEKDLANIFGKKSLKKNAEEKKTEEPVEEKNVENKFLFNGGSITDYFKKKIPNFGKINGYVIGNNGVLKKEEEEEPETRTKDLKKENHESEDDVCSYQGFGFQEQPKQETFISYVNDNHEIPEKKKKEKKKKRKLEETEDTEITKKVKTDSNEYLGLNNPAFNPMCTPVKLQKHVLNTIEENYENSQESICEESEKIDVSVQINNEITPKKRKNNEENEDIDDSKKKKKKNKDTIEDLEVVEKKKKKKDKDIGLSNPGFPAVEPEENLSDPKQVKKKKKKKTNDGKNDVVSVENASENVEINPYEVKVKKKKKKMSTDTEEDFAVKNPSFNANLTEEETITSNNIEENPYEVKVKSKKKKKKSTKEEEYVIDNPGFNPDDSVAPQILNEEFEVKRKKKRKETENGFDNPCLDLNDSKNDDPNENKLNTLEIVEDNELMLNIISTPISKPQLNSSTGILSSSKTNSVKRRKSVRFSNVNEERLIPSIRALQQLEDTERRNELFDINNEVINKNLESGKKRKLGLDNSAFDRNTTNLEENVDSIAKTLDQYQAEIENDINEAKLKTVEMSDIMIGEVGNPQGDNEKLENGSAKLKFKHAKFGRTPGYIENMTGPKKSYKHLIKGDIVVNFKESNLHEIQGYGSEKMIEA